MTGTADEIVIWLMRQEKRDAVYDIKEHKKRRSLNANDYFHVLCDKLRQKLGISLIRCKNMLVARYGQVEYLETGETIGYTTLAPPEYMLEQEEPHTWLIDTRVQNGKTWYTYRIYRKTREYDSAEMAKLIDGTIIECEQVGIETATPEEIARMKALWGNKHEKKHSD